MIRPPFDGGQSLQHSRVPELDGFRGIALLLVLLGHFFQFSLISPGPWGEVASLGVLLFFALSGYLITSLLCSESRSAGAVDLKKFYTRRALRLLPAAWLLIMTVAVLKVAGAVEDESWGGVVGSLLYVRNVLGSGHTLGHLWSLSLEEQFYFLWPIAFVLFPRHRLSISIGVTVGVALLRSGLWALDVFDHRTGVFYLRPWFRFDSIMCGCVLALLRQHNPGWFDAPPGWARAVTHPGWVIPALVATMLLNWKSGPQWWCLSVQTVMVVLLLARVIMHGSTLVTGALRTPSLGTVGRLSYSLYLWQQIFVVTKLPDWGPLRAPFLDVLMAALCGLISYRFVEQPFLRLKERFQSRSPVPVVDPAPVERVHIVVPRA